MMTSATVLTACGSDDDDEGSSDKSSNIVGEWVTAYESSTYMMIEIMQLSANGSFTDTTYELYGNNLTSSNQTLTSLEKNVDTGKYSASGNRLYITLYGETQTFDYSLSSSGNNLTLTYSEDGRSASITFERMTSQERKDIAEIESVYQQINK